VNGSYAKWTGPPPLTNMKLNKRHLPAALASRFICIYLFLTSFVILCGVFLAVIPPVGDFFDRIIHSAYNNAGTWTAVHMFHLSGAVTLPHPTGSGDTTLGYIHEFLMLALAAVMVLPWSLIGPLHRRECSVYPWVKLSVRLMLAYFLLVYGFMKVYPNQFESPDLGRLMETYGESSPMGLMWAFMGASTPYQIFCGSCEAAAGLLLLFRRTTTVGALLGAAVMLHIAVLNFCFDVPVKLFSCQLFLMCLFLLWDDLNPLFHFLVLRRSARLEEIVMPKLESKWLRYARTGLQILVPLWFLWQTLPDERTGYNSSLVPNPKLQPLRGIWEADAGSANSVVWKKIVLDRGRRIAVWTGEGQLLRFIMAIDAAKHSLKLKGWRNDHTCELSYQLSGAEHLILKGKIDQQPVELRFHKVPIPTFLLTTRGFHWISEDPYNY
jgi:uncharacterized membrane protein YphA (DoxX/SURF4 family)